MDRKIHEMESIAETDMLLKLRARSYACVALSSSPINSERFPALLSTRAHLHVHVATATYPIEAIFLHLLVLNTATGQGRAVEEPAAAVVVRGHLLVDGWLERHGVDGALHLAMFG